MRTGRLSWLLAGDRVASITATPSSEAGPGRVEEAHVHDVLEARFRNVRPGPIPDLAAAFERRLVDPPGIVPRRLVETDLRLQRRRVLAGEVLLRDEGVD